MERPKHHPTFAPSSHDALVKCPFYASDPTGSEATRKGTEQHEYAETLLNDLEIANKGDLSAEDRDNVEWYVDLVRAQASGDLEIEIAAELQDKNYGVITWGTIDAAAGGEIWITSQTVRNVTTSTRWLATRSCVLGRRD